jgi:hypothetical protein
MASRKEITPMAFANFEYCHKEMEVRFQNNWDQPSVLFR